MIGDRNTLGRSDTDGRRRPRILLVIPAAAASTGGIAKVGHSLMRLLREKCNEGFVEYRVHSLMRPDDGEESQLLQSLHGDRLRAFFAGRGTFALHTLWRMCAWADLVIFTHVGLGSLLNLVPRPCRPKSLIWIHGLEVWKPLSLRNRWALLNADIVVSISRFTEEQARASNPWLREVQCCPLGVPEVESQTIEPEAELGCRPGRRDILIVGRMAKGQGMKGHQLLFSIMQDVKRAVPEARLLVAGGGDDVVRFQELAKETPAADRIHFLGYVPDSILRGLYHRCGVFVMPSSQDGFGLVYLEAMQAGLPCIGLQHGPAAEIIVSGITGHLVPLHDPRKLTAAIISALADDDRRSCLGEAARQRYRELFTERAFHRRFWELLELAVAK